MEVKVLERIHFRFVKDGHTLCSYDFNHNRLNGVFYAGENANDMMISLELLVDRTSVEIFADGGRFTVIDQLPEPENDSGLSFDENGPEIRVIYLEVHELKSIW
jgi:sucrose-6-phosphate hydrolase SacC (GH32 family)